MSDTSQDQKHSIVQPPLREPEADERVVRVAGLKFILPCKWAAGDVLDEESAAFINTAWHTAVINRFGAIRQLLLDDPATTYEKFDAELQAFFDEFSWTPRPSKATSEKPKRTEEDKALESFARPLFNKAMKGHGLSRERYEELLQKYISENRDTLLASMERQRVAVGAITQSLIAGIGKE